VLDGGRVLWDGPVVDLVATANGKVWLAGEEEPAALSSWRTGTGRYRHVALDPPVGVETTEPNLEDAYLLLRAEAGSDPREVSA
jgi:ABC-2 type transport system ATP-binding protein